MAVFFANFILKEVGHFVEKLTFNLLRSGRLRQRAIFDKCCNITELTFFYIQNKFIGCVNASRSALQKVNLRHSTLNEDGYNGLLVSMPNVATFKFDSPTLVTYGQLMNIIRLHQSIVAVEFEENIMSFSAVITQILTASIYRTSMWMDEINIEKLKKWLNVNSPILKCFEIPSPPFSATFYQFYFYFF